MTHEFVPARRGDAIRLARSMRPEIAKALALRGIEPRRAMDSAFRGSDDVVALRIGGKVVAMYGVERSVMTGKAKVWMHVAPQAREHLRAIAVAVREEFPRFCEKGGRFETWVDSTDAAACRMARRLGFTLGDADALGLRPAVLETP